MDRVLCIIPARGGSKAAPRKNIRPICGKPLIAYTIETALSAQTLFHRIVVSTDDEEIADISRQCGADVPFLRPADLASDNVPTIPVLQHAVRFVERQDEIQLDWIMLLQPTAPFRARRDLEEVLRLGRLGGCDSVISVTQVFAHHPALMKRIEQDRLLPYCVEESEGMRRQDYNPPAYMRNGAIYLTRREVLMEHNSIWGKFIRPYLMSPDKTVNIDDELDLKIAELLIKDRLSLDH